MEQAINQPPAKVKLMKMSKGYQWEISITGDDAIACAETAAQVDDKLKAMYPSDQ